MRTEDVKRKFLAHLDVIAIEANKAWLEAMKLNRCVTCAARDLEERLVITREGRARATHAAACMEFCRDDGWLLEPVGGREFAGKIGGKASACRSRPESRELIRRSLAVSVELEKAWAKAQAFAECDDCAAAILRKLFAMAAAKTRRFIPPGAGREGYRRVCGRCASNVVGVV